MSYLEYLDLKQELADIKQDIAALKRSFTMALEDSVTRIVAAAQTEAQQLADAIGALAAQVDEATQLRVELDALKVQADSAASRLDEASAALESDDPTV